MTSPLQSLKRLLPAGPEMLVLELRPVIHSKISDADIRTVSAATLRRVAMVARLRHIDATKMPGGDPLTPKSWADVCDFLVEIIGANAAFPDHDVLPKEQVALTDPAAAGVYTEEK